MSDIRIDANSKHWSHLSDDDRFVIVEAARDRFAIEFGSLPEINCIGNNCDAIYVETKLPYGQPLAALPAKFESFPVEQTGVREAMDRFICTWKTVLTRIARWSPEDACQWASDEHRHFKGGFFLHDSPIEIVALELVPVELRNKPRAERAICDAILAQRPKDLWHPDRDPDYDWAAAYSRVQAAIERLRSERGAEGNAAVPMRRETDEQTDEREPE